MMNPSIIPFNSTLHQPSFSLTSSLYLSLSNTTTYKYPKTTMSISLSSFPPSLSSSLFPNALSPPPMSFLRRLSPPLRRRFSTVSASATAIWTPSPISLVEPAADESLFHIFVDVDDDLAASHTRAGQYLQLRLPESTKPAFLAIASPPKHASVAGEFCFLVKSVEGSTAEILCRLKKGDVVELTHAAGNGFDVDRISNSDTVFIFATGSGISPIRSLIESGFNADKRSDVRLYYGARNLQRMAYQDRFKNWETSGVKIIPVLSQPNEGWTGETGYVQAAFSKSKGIFSPNSTGAVLSGQKQMAEEITSILTTDGVSTDKILKNF